MKYLVGIILSGLLLAGCSSSRITSSWSQPEISPRPFGKLLVLSLVPAKDRQIRQSLEDHMAGDLKDLGYPVVTASDEFGPGSFENLKEKEALDLLRERGIDGVITIVLLDKQMETIYIPKQSRMPETANFRDRFWSYYNQTYSMLGDPGYYYTSARFFWESNLYEVGGQTLLHSVQTHSFDPPGVETLAHQYGKIIVKNMLKQSVLSSQDPSVKKAF